VELRPTSVSSSLLSCGIIRFGLALKRIQNSKAVQIVHIHCFVNSLELRSVDGHSTRRLNRRHRHRRPPVSDVGVFRPGPVAALHSWGVWSLVDQSFESPDGETFSRTFVRSPGVVAVVPIRISENGPQVVLLRQYRPSLDRELWEIPAGMRDVRDEPVEDAARREMAEETGYRGGRWSSLGTVAQSPGMSNSIVHLFAAQGVEPGPSTPQGPEERYMSVHEVPLTTAVAMVERGEIINAVAVVGILRVARLW